MKTPIDIPEPDLDRAVSRALAEDSGTGDWTTIAENGQLKWMLDAYTSTNRYPYSQRLADGTNYMRNSVKVVIDAYDGTVEAYVIDPADPLIRTYARIFPGLLKPASEMPADMRAHMRYPTDLFSIQSLLYATYHMDSPETFYHREDQWQVPSVGEQGDAAERRFMRHIVMKLPEESRAEFIYMAPFTPRGKDNLASWMIARNDGDNYGKLRVYQFPKQSLVYGPRQIMSRIDQDTEIARELTLWDQRGSQVMRGELLVMYLVGLGATNPVVPSGAASPITPLARPVKDVSVSIDGQPAQIAFSGMTPGGVGLAQINFYVPANARLNAPLDVVVTQDGVPANTTKLTVAP